jgi:hypothetical protein
MARALQVVVDIVCGYEGMWCDCVCLHVVLCLCMWCIWYACSRSSCNVPPVEEHSARAAGPVSPAMPRAECVRVSRGARVRQAFRRAQVTFAKSAALAHQAPGDGRPEIGYVHMRGTRAVCACARTHVCLFLPCSLSLAGALARALSRSLVLSLSFPLSRSLCGLSACVRSSMWVPHHHPELRPLALRAKLGVRARQVLWAFKRGQVEPPECCLLNSRPRAYFQGAGMRLMLSIFFVKFLNDVSS